VLLGCIQTNSEGIFSGREFQGESYLGGSFHSGLCHGGRKHSMKGAPNFKALFKKR